MFHEYCTYALYTLIIENTVYLLKVLVAVKISFAPGHYNFKHGPDRVHGTIYM